MMDSDTLPVPSLDSESSMEGTFPAGSMQTPVAALSPDQVASPVLPIGNVITSSNLGLDPSQEELYHMVQTVVSVFELEEGPAVDHEMSDEDEEVDLEDQKRRTDRLKEGLSTVAQLWWSGSEYMDVVAEKLADGSRDRK